MIQRLFLASLLLTLLAGCGYRLAGSIDSASLAGTRVVDASRSGGSELVWSLEQDLKLRGVAASADGEGRRVLRILGETFERRPLTLTSEARTAEYELIGRAEFELLGGDGRVLIPTRSIMADGVYLRDSSRLLGSSQEEARLRKEIRDELVRRILIAVAAVDPS